MDENEIKAELALEKQIRSEFKASSTALSGMWNKWRKNLKLYANNRKDRKAVGDNTLYEIHNTFLASVWNDKFSVSFEPEEYGDKETAEILNQMASFDYRKMGKANADYDWYWNSLFYGRSIVEMKEFDVKDSIPRPRVWDTINTYPDPMATSVNGTNGDGASRFIGRMVQKSMWQMKKEGYDNLDTLESWKPDDRLEQTKQARDDARGITYQKDNIEGDNKLYTILEWYTHHNGEKKLFHVGATNDEQSETHIKILKRTTLKQQDRFPLIDCAPMKIPGEWYGLTIPDLVEDKQRAKARLKNIGIDSTEFATYIRMIYNGGKIKNKSDLNVNSKKNIEVDGQVDGAIRQVEKPTLPANFQEILNMISQDANTATATPDILQGTAQSGANTLGEIDKISANSANRYGLAISLFQESAISYWKQWYYLYKNFFKGGIRKKAVRLKGTYGVEFRKLTSDQISMVTDPDVRIIPLSEKKRADREKLIFLSSAGNLVTVMEGVDKRAYLRSYLEAGGQTTAQINRIVPQTADELDAEDENKSLSENKEVRAELNENHAEHIAVHRRAAETAAKKAHIMAHRKFLKIKKDREPKPEPSNNQARVPEAQFQNTGIPTEQQGE